MIPPVHTRFGSCFWRVLKLFLLCCASLTSDYIHRWESGLLLFICILKVVVVKHSSTFFFNLYCLLIFRPNFTPYPTVALKIFTVLFLVWHLELLHTYWRVGGRCQSDSSLFFPLKKKAFKYMEFNQDWQGRKIQIDKYDIK